MSLSFIYRFQLNIYQALLASEKIKEQINEINLSTAQDGNYPSILINIIKIEDKSRADFIIYSVEFEICIFSRDKNRKILLSISENIEDALSIKKLGFQEYNVAGINLINLAFDEAQDLIHNKLTMNYKAMLKK